MASLQQGNYCHLSFLSYWCWVPHKRCQTLDPFGPMHPWSILFQQCLYDQLLNDAHLPIKNHKNKHNETTKLSYATNDRSNPISQTRRIDSH